MMNEDTKGLGMASNVQDSQVENNAPTMAFLSFFVGLALQGMQTLVMELSHNPVTDK